MSDIILSVQASRAKYRQDQERLSERVKGILSMDRVVDERKIHAAEMKRADIKARYTKT